MQNLALKFLAMTISAMHAPKDEKGQGTIEYLGAIIVAVVIIIATIDAVGNLGIGEAIAKQVETITSKA
ncbi:hypothetical protein [Aeromicrobium sp. A1-2]|uniref:hypothetical protein n=1 Tax=Aeromicrobium sp. A1-2 TaxID=2107713 RepID=UPI0013C2E020|nr:hypothetical protein [Aeromicrobium sp. A1-2]